MYNTDMPTRAELPSTGKLLRSTAIALISAAAILVAVVLPAEYGIDPTGIGTALNLTEMGEIKTELAREAEADAALDAAVAPQPASQPPTPVVAAPEVPAMPSAPAIPVAPPAPAAPERQSSVLGLLGGLIVSPAHAQESRQDEMTFTLQPGEGIEIKMSMNEGDTAAFAWAVSEGGAVNFDLHGDGNGQSISLVRSPWTEPRSWERRWLELA